MLYETAARAGEVFALNVEDLDLAHRRAVVIGKGGRAELIGWETKTARLLPRLLHQRREGPLFLADITPAPARQPALADLDPGSGRARLSYRRAAEVFKLASGGATLHQLRHSRLTHLAEAGIALPILTAKSRQSSLGIYAKPTFDAVAAATAAIDPDRRRRSTRQRFFRSLAPTVCPALVSGPADRGCSAAPPAGRWSQWLVVVGMKHSGVGLT